jgi:hypothetical protein
MPLAFVLVAQPVRPNDTVWLSSFVQVPGWEFQVVLEVKLPIW